MNVLQFPGSESDQARIRLAEIRDQMLDPRRRLSREQLEEIRRELVQMIQDLSGQPALASEYVLALTTMACWFICKKNKYTAKSYLQFAKVNPKWRDQSLRQECLSLIAGAYQMQGDFLRAVFYAVRAAHVR